MDKCESSSIVVQESRVSCNIVDIRDFGEYKEKRVEKWLTQKISELYEDDSDFVLENPLIRISTMFEGLSEEAQYELYGYAKRAALKDQGERSMYKIFWNYVEMAPSAWEDIEKFANDLLRKEKIY